MKQTYKNEQIRNAFFKWLDLPREKRDPQTIVAFSKKHGIRRETLSVWKRDYKQGETISVEVGEIEKIPDPIEWLKRPENQYRMIVATMESAEKGNANSQKILAQLSGILVEKTDQKVTVIDADNIIRTMLDAKRRLKENNRGVDEVRTEPTLLLDNVCDDSGQGTDEDGSLAALGTFSEVSQDAVIEETDRTL